MVAILALDEGRPPGARVVAGLGALDLDDVGAEIGEHLSGPRSGENARQLQHANAGQWALIRTRRRTRHGQLPSSKRDVMGRETRVVWPEKAVLSIAQGVNGMR
jgi:hypothetical protein